MDSAYIPVVRRASIVAVAVIVFWFALTSRPDLRKQPASEPVSQYFVGENIEYYPPYPEFKLAREAASMTAYKADLDARAQNQEPVQTLPAGGSMKDNVEYFAPSAEFKSNRSVK